MVDSGGDGAVGGMPQLLLGSIVVGNSGMVSAKVQPSVVSMVALLDVLVCRGGFLRVFIVELTDAVLRVVNVLGWVPGSIGIIETCPLDLILDLVPVAS